MNTKKNHPVRFVFGRKDGLVHAATISPLASYGRAMCGAQAPTIGWRSDSSLKATCTHCAKLARALTATTFETRVASTLEALRICGRDLAKIASDYYPYGTRVYVRDPRSPGVGNIDGPMRVYIGAQTITASITVLLANGKRLEYSIDNVTPERLVNPEPLVS